MVYLAVRIVPSLSTNGITVLLHTFLHDLQFQIPVDVRLTVTLPQNVHGYLACCDTSIFLTCLRRDAP